MCQHSSAAVAQLWESLAGLRGSAARCTCSDMQLSHVGCDCDARQNLPVGCEECGSFCRTEREISTRVCNGCRHHAAREASNDGPIYCECGARCLTETEQTFRLCGRCGDDLYDSNN